MIDIRDEDLEWHPWPPRQQGGQHAGPYRGGVLLVHKPTGLAASSVTASTMRENKRVAQVKLRTALRSIDPKMIAAWEAL